MDENSRYPALIVSPRSEDYRRQVSGGGKPHIFENIEKSQEMLLQSCDTIKADLNKTGQQKIGIARLKLRDEALAKSHRPIESFTEETCPVIGDFEEPGELLVLVSETGLDRLSKKLRQLGTVGSAHLTSIESFTLLERERRFPSRVRLAILDRLQRNGYARLKIRMPSFHILAPAFKGELYHTFREELYQQKITLVEMGVQEEPYLRQGYFEIYAVQIHDIEQAASLASLSFVDRLEVMPMYFATGSLVFDTATLKVNTNYPINELPVVAIVDTGIDPNSPLEALVCGRERYVPSAEYDPSHGTSVAALAAALDGKVGEVIAPRCRLIDVTVLPGRGKIDEDRLIERLEFAVAKYGSVAKHWNLSLAVDPGSQPRSEFSDFAMKLDDLHKEYGVMFYCAAGNVSAFRNCWPPDSNDPEWWINSPGDTVCGITVGACTDENTPDDALAPKGAPSPFSPRGPVAYGVIKPDLLDIGGNIASDGTFIGIDTILRNGDPTSSTGTSFATPRVCGMSTEVQGCIERSNSGNGKPYLLTKALMLHHAKIPETFVLGGNIQVSDYYGYGIPSPLQDTIGDYFWRSTTLICSRLYPNGEDLVIDDFPYPDGLCSGKRSWGQIWITMVSDPILDMSHKLEYVRSNVDVHFGTMSRGTFRGQAKCVYAGAGNEKSLIREKHKWSPIKQYRSPTHMIYSGDNWRLRVGLTVREKESVLIRTGAKKAENYPVDVVIAITIADPQRLVQVNNQVFQKWRMRGYIPAQVEVAPRLRTRFATNS